MIIIKAYGTESPTADYLQYRFVIDMKSLKNSEVPSN